MKTGTKAIYLNSAISVGLALELYLGRPLYAVGISAVVLFTVANLILFVSYKKARRR